MKSFLVLFGVCAVAQAQFNSFGGQSNRLSSRTSNQVQQNAYGNQFQNQAARTQTQNVASGIQDLSQRTQYAGSCRENNERYPVSGSCDQYVECVNGTAEEKLCPDGLRFDPNLAFHQYPCKYPNEVQCLERSALQPAQPTENCPNQFGYFKLGDTRNCSSFRNCVNGQSYDFTCPEGLAYSSASYRCEWPDEVADCDAEAFLGFSCPAIPTTKDLGEPAGYRFYRSETDCQKYFICIDGRPRALGCGGYSAFDDLTSTCVSADEVSFCPPELRELAVRTRELEQQRLAKQIEFDARPASSKRRYKL